MVGNQSMSLRVFGCLTFASILTGNIHKFDPRGRKCIFLEYLFDIKRYKLLDMETNKVIISRNITFHERVFPYSNKKWRKKSQTSLESRIQ